MTSLRIMSARKLVPCGKRTDAEDVGQRLSEIRERLPRAQIDAGLDASAMQQQRHVLARVIGARRGRIVAVIGGNHQQIVVSELRQQAAPAARRSAPGSPHSRRCRCDGRRPCRSPRGSRRSGRAAASPSAPRPGPCPRRRSWWDAIGNAAPGKQIRDLADRRHCWPAATRRSSSVSAIGGIA